MSLTFGSYCAGIEAASVASAHLGWRAAFLSEIAAFPRQVLRHRHGAEDAERTRAGLGPLLWGDFTALRVRHLRRLGVALPDLICGGTPCQAFSFAGARRSLADARGNLSLEFIRQAHAIDNARAERGDPGLVLVWENVPGVLSTGDNAFGCFLGGLVGHDDAVPVPDGGRRWPDAGLVAGPRAWAAWRVLDAQYFGLAQRRRRVFVVAGFRNVLDPAAILFERKGLSGNTSTRRETGEGFTHDVAPSLTASGRGVERPGETRGQDPVVACFGGGNRSGPVEVAACLVAAGQKLDFEVETFVTHTLRGEGFDASEDGTGRGIPLVPVAFRTTGNDGTYETGEAIGALTTGADPASHVICFSSKDFGGDAEVDLAPTLRAGGRDGSHANAGVRRLTPRECERLQGFPDDYTLVPIRKGMAADGPRYKALGNSWPVPVVRWIFNRIDARLREQRLAA